MISAFDVILGTILVVILGDVLFSGIIMIHIHFSAKRSWKKNNKSYPYFSYPFLKKIFFFGLKGCVKSCYCNIYVFNVFVRNINDNCMHMDNNLAKSVDIVFVQMCYWD